MMFADVAVTVATVVDAGAVITAVAKIATTRFISHHTFPSFYFNYTIFFDRHTHTEGERPRGLVTIKNIDGLTLQSL